VEFPILRRLPLPNALPGEIYCFIKNIKTVHPWKQKQTDQAKGEKMMPKKKKKGLRRQILQS